jgi:hypothetical protein
VRYSKYRAIRTEVDGLKFDSKAEARTYTKLQLLRRAGEVTKFDIHPVFVLPAGIKYEADFRVYWADGRVEIVDVKGVKTAVYRLKKKLMKSIGYEISEWKP